MKTPRLMKVIAAFVTGVLVTLVATLLFPGAWGRSSADSLPQEAPVHPAGAPSLRSLPETGHPAPTHVPANPKRESAKAPRFTASVAEERAPAMAAVRNVIPLSIRLPKLFLLLRPLLRRQPTFHLLRRKHPYLFQPSGNHGP